jgi:uncharacterized protein YigA (DUF484 family)
MQQPDADSATVIAWLRANPSFVAEHPGLYDVLDPPRRVHGPVLADHMAAMVDAARARAREAERVGTLAAASRRATEGFTRRVHHTVLALMRAPDPAWLATHELATLLQVDAARVCAETPLSSDIAAIPRGTVSTTLGQRAAIVRPAAPDAVLHGEAVALATQEALVRVPLRTGPAILAIACRDTDGLAGATTDTLAFLGQAIAAALEHT